MTTKADLKANTVKGACLLCEYCGMTNSADPGDYWHLSDDYVFTCSHSDEPTDDLAADPMVLAVPRNGYEILSR